MTHTIRVYLNPDGRIEIQYSTNDNSLDDNDIVVDLITKLQQNINEKSIPISTSVLPKNKTAQERGITDTEKQHYMERLPKQDDIIKYIESLGGDYTHSLFDIHEHFFNRRFYSVRNRKNASTDEKNEHYVYTRFYERVRRSRKKIAQKKGGKWKEEWKYPSNKPKYKVWRLEM